MFIGTGHVVIAVIVILASSVLWGYIYQRELKNKREQNLLLGISHFLLTKECLRYLDRGWVTRAEYDSLYAFLYTPYKNMGGNGLAGKLIQDVNKLPIFDSHESRNRSGG